MGLLADILIKTAIEVHGKDGKDTLKSMGATDKQIEKACELRASRLKSEGYKGIK